jgi:hypothetical protein
VFALLRLPSQHAGRWPAACAYVASPPSRPCHGRCGTDTPSSAKPQVTTTAASGLPIDKLVLYEPPFNPDDSYPALPGDLASRLAELVAAGHRGEAVELYQTAAVGMPPSIVGQMRHAPFRPGLEAIAHTLAYDAALLGGRSLSTDLIGSIPAPTLVIRGGQGHDIDPEATAPVIAGFLTS